MLEGLLSTGLPRLVYTIRVGGFLARYEVNNWIISVVDSSVLCPIWPVQVNQSKYENYKMRGPSGAMMFFLA